MNEHFKTYLSSSSNWWRKQACIQIRKTINMYIVTLNDGGGGEENKRGGFLLPLSQISWIQILHTHTGE